MCELYWRLYEQDIPVLTGPSPLARVLGCPAPCDCDVVVYVGDRERIGRNDCVWATSDPTFIHRPIWIGGYPHVAPEDLKNIISPEVSSTVECIMKKLRGEVHAP
ncbi:hypothetical protein Pogu_0407 [Pyrobaculum oguniense TE7]|uniref:Uncharacterized protein n=1 Tax=Pyrobaculum oguniense (strain DSM 13380 / JCM 10595 / TE7) TaxID=698757 RepID=H6Q736_PYROT|nr:hypothetical protein Pogu_0407 [Pyrobaculum oguniense TE7]